MPYGHIPGVKTSLVDGAFKLPRATSQPKILVVGPASSGLSNELYTVTDVSTAEVEFGSATPLMRVVHELAAQGADNIAVVRSGGRQGSVVVTDSASATLTISPEGRDNEILERYALIVENDGSENRYLVYDLVDESFVYDSSDIEVLDTGVVVLTDTGLDLFTLNDRTSPSTAISLADMVPSDFTADGDATLSTVTASAGADGLDMSLVEKYAAYNATYHGLDYRDGDFIVPADVYVDDANIAYDASAATYGYFWKGVPVADTSSDKLGYVWQYLFKGTLYTYFVDTATYFSVAIAGATKTVATDLVLTAERDGKGGNANTIQIALGLSASAVVSENSNGGLDILLTAINGVTTTSAAATLINNALAAFTLSNGVTGDTLVSAAGGATAIAATVAKANFTGGTGGHVLTHEDLTGDVIPSEVSTRFAAGADAELREVNFAHQLASHCHVASRNWAQLLGSISFKAPTSYTRSSIATWIGSPATYTDTGEYKFIDAPADNGSAILGNKFLAGESKTSAGYRSHMVTDGNSTDGYAYGGFILTVGRALPNGAEWPYGIDSSDEAVDSKGEPVDIGKHIFVTYDWPIHSNGYNGGKTYRGSIAATFIGKLAVLPENEEPIGENGLVRKVQTPPRIHASQLDALAEIRAVGLRREDGLGLKFVSAKTAAHPDSDYSRASTIRCVNRHLKAIRRIARPYIGKSFDGKRLISLQSSIDQYLLAETSNGYNQGAKAKIVYSRTDKIMGQLRVSLRLIPPFSIESIDVETSLAAEESEL